MAQLIKLQDYVSRYEKDSLRYPSQFVRLKKQQWSKIKEQWEEGSVFLNDEDAKQFRNDIQGKEGLVKRFRKIWVKEEEHPLSEAAEQPSESDSFNFEPKVYYRPDTLDDLKHLYMDQLYQIQLTWASSTLTEKSYVDGKYAREEPLRFFLQRFPDTYLVMYEPVMLIKKAPIELDILVFTPTELWCITLLEDADQSAYLGSMNRFWTVKAGEQEKRMLNPSISLDRTETIIKGLFNQQNLDFPIRKAIISRNGYIDFKDAPYGLTLLDKKSFPDWFSQQRSMRAPLKGAQLRAVKTVLDLTQTTSVRRMMWSEELQETDLPENSE
ncbi:NERD domain-containing protein [Jeotgalibacillus proteolyticus]|uniref:NERD domain-containing protein n=1 Tax=Jeotgalibacillus proteolyticus TaxID=2082395 RepID=UPI003CE725F1